MKDIILPWTCETHEKLKTIRNWLIRILFPIMTILSLTTDIHKYSEILVMNMLMVGIIGSVLTWIISIVIWMDDGMFPSVRCKCKTKEKEGSSNDKKMER